MQYGKIAEKFGVSKKQAERIVKYAFEVLRDEIEETGRGFAGRDFYFKKVERPSRNYRNPRTGELATSEPATFIILRKKV